MKGNTTMNMYVLEIRDGIELFFNRRTVERDGWYWGPDNEPMLHGPYQSSEAAAEDARTTSERPVKVVTVTSAYDELGLDEEVGIIIVDTGGRVWVKTGEAPCDPHLRPVN
jgi:hypothetical protein